MAGDGRGGRLVLLSAVSVLLFPLQAEGQTEATRSEATRSEAPSTRAPDSARISVTFQGTPIEDVAATIAEFAGISVVLGREVAGPVTAVLDDVPWRAALQAVLDTQGLSGRWLTDDILTISRAQTRSLEQDEATLTTRVFGIRHQPAAELAGAVEGVLSQRGTLGVAEHSNALVVTDTPDVLLRIERLLWGGGSGR